MQMLHKNIFTTFLLVNLTAHESFYHHLISLCSRLICSPFKMKNKTSTLFKILVFYIIQAPTDFMNVKVTWHTCKHIVYIEQCFLSLLCLSCTTHCMHFFVFCQTFHLTNEPKYTITDELQVYSIYLW